MRKNMTKVLLIGVLCTLAVMSYARREEGKSFSGPCEPGMMHDGGMMPPPPHHPGMMKKGNWMCGPGNPTDYFIPEVHKILEETKIKMEKLFLDAKQSRIDLDTKRKELVDRLNLLSEKYSQDKSVGKDIVSLTKELNNIQDQIMAINDDAMKKMQALHKDREQDIKTARDNWLKRLDTDVKELEKYVDFLRQRSDLSDQPNKKPMKK